MYFSRSGARSAAEAHEQRHQLATQQRHIQKVLADDRA
jgi:hypothetical protein